MIRALAILSQFVASVAFDPRSVEASAVRSETIQRVASGALRSSAVEHSGHPQQSNSVNIFANRVWLIADHDSPMIDCEYAIVFA